MAVTIKSSGPRGAKTYEVRVDGALYDYTDTKAAATRLAARARKEQKAGKLDRYGNRRNPAVKVKAIRVKNFTGTISNVRGKTVVKGRSKGR